MAVWTMHGDAARIVVEHTVVEDQPRILLTAYRGRLRDWSMYLTVAEARRLHQGLDEVAMEAASEPGEVAG